MDLTTGFGTCVGVLLKVVVGFTLEIDGAAAEVEAGIERVVLPPNRDDIKLGLLGAGASEGTVAEDDAMVEAGLGLTCGVGEICAFVDTLIDGVNLKSVLLSLFKIPDKSVVSFMKGGLVDELNGEVGWDFISVKRGFAFCCCITGEDGTDWLAAFEDSADNVHGSDLVLLGSTNRDKSSIGTTQSGCVPPIFDVLSCIISILLIILLDAVGDCDPLVFST